jgi:predicted metalloprotease with PDZ domain
VSERTEQFDVYHAPSYDHLIDGPVMYCKPDTATFNVNGTRVLVALAHRRDTSLAQAYADDLEKVTFAIEKFLPSLPVDRYAFLLYLWDGDTVNVKRARYSQGALEHSYSSFYFWRLTTRPFGLRDVAAHEFLHILVPLNVHSREIDEFNFRNPEWSAHLWLYEGVTEYFAEQSLLRSGIFNESTFLNHVKRGARSMQHLPDGFSLADFSRNVLSDENQSLYPLIYQYGPINALVMDIILREEMGTKGGLLELVYALMDRYGPSKPFDDDELFDVISELSSKRVADYCKTYINGSKRVPLAEYLPKIGMTYSDSVLAEAWTFDVDITSSTQTEGGLMIAPLDKNPLGVEEGDRLVAVDGVEVSRENSRILRRLWNPQSDSTISLTVVRSGMTIELSGKPNKTAVVRQHVVEEIPNATAEQVAFRNLVLYGSTTSPFKDNR